MANPVLSVIIPTYQRFGILCELMESLLLQNRSREEMEVIVVNDCGDKVDAVIALYPELNITVMHLEINLGHVHARNAALARARGEYILLCDDDDLLLPGHVDRMLNEIVGFDLAYSDVEIVDYVITDGVRQPKSRLLFAYEYDLEAMRRFSTFVPSGCLYRKEIHEKLGSFDADMYHYWDWDFFLRVSAGHRVKRVPVASVLYSFTGQNLSDNLADMRPFLARLCAKHGLGELPAKNFFLLLEEPEVRERMASSEVVWDGSPIISRLASNPEAM